MRKLIWIAAACVWSTAAAPQSQGPAGDVKAPKLLESADPEYSVQARLAKLAGVLRVTVVVGEDGVPRLLSVKDPLGLGLDQQAMKAVGQWKFTPGTKNGQPAAMEIPVEVSFHLLLDPREWHLTRAVVTTIAEASQAVLQKAPYPEPKGLPEHVAIDVTFDIDTRGVPVNVRAGAGKYSGEVAAMVKNWRFQPAMQGGVAVGSKAKFSFERGASR